MKIYTIQIAKRKKLEGTDIEFIDTTVKSGDRRLSPTWGMVMGVKQTLGEAPPSPNNPPITVDEFKRQYRDILQRSIIDHPDFWRELVNKPSIAVACYCSVDKPNPFCHRFLLKQAILHLCKLKNIPTVDGGEIT